jgi:hypothetical protein
MVYWIMSAINFLQHVTFYTQSLLEFLLIKSNNSYSIDFFSFFYTYIRVENLLLDY